MKELTVSEIANGDDTTLEEDEGIIEHGLTTFMAVGSALLRIREGKKYQAKGYETFAIYCQERWHFTARHAHRMMDAAEVVREIGPIGPMPATESQVRELAQLPDAESRRNVWRAVVEEHGANVTAAKVRDAVQGYSEFRRHEEIIDRARETLDALATIYREGLYRETHPTFEGYCRERWDLHPALVEFVMGGVAA